MNESTKLDTEKLPDGIRSRFVDGVNGLKVHILEAGFDPPDQPRVLLLHGFPELAYSWRKVMVPLATAGFHVIAPDQRGYGRTTGWDADYDGDLASFSIPNLVRDIVALVWALGYESVASVVGHDFGSPVAAYCALIRPDVFHSVALMSAPFEGPPTFPIGFAAGDNATRVVTENSDESDIDETLAALERPRKHYKRYYCTRSADNDMRHCQQGLAAFLRAYFHYKSADWAGNDPYPLRSWTAEELSKMPTYYIMDRDLDMAQTVAPYMLSDEESAACSWLTEEELQTYVQEFSRTGFQGGLQWYRCGFNEEQIMELRLFSGRTIDVPSCFIGGIKDWGVYQVPGAFEKMQGYSCTQMISCDLVVGAGHWVQQEQPEQVVKLLKHFLSCHTLFNAVYA